jgi:hypothetical protein
VGLAEGFGNAVDAESQDPADSLVQIDVMADRYVHRSDAGDGPNRLAHRFAFINDRRSGPALRI